MPLASAVSQILQGTTGTLVADGFNRGWEAAVPRADYPLAQRSEILDPVTCDLCRSVDGAVISKSDPRYRRWTGPLHINCRGIMLHIHRSEVGPDGKPTRADWTDPDPELIEKHGHFVARPLKYEPLRVPARPTGRDFIAYRARGAPHVTLRWRDALPNWALRETLQTMASGFGDRLATLSMAGDAELASQMLAHASDRQLFANLTDLHARRAAEWADTAGPLSKDDLRSVPTRMIDDPATTLGTNVDDSGSVEWMLHNEKLPLDAKRSLDDVVTVYDPKQADITDILRAPGEVSPPIPADQPVKRAPSPPLPQKVPEADQLAGDAWMESLTDDEVDAFCAWAEEGNWEEIRAASRGEAASDEAQKHLGAIEQALARHADSETAETVYRGLHDIAEDAYDALRNLQPGETLSLESPASATWDEGIAEYFATEMGEGTGKPVIMEWDSYSGADISAYSRYPDEREFLFQRGTKLHVVGVDDEADILHIYLREL